MASNTTTHDEMAVTPYLQGTSALLTSGAFSDLVIHCGKRSWKVHKTVMCTQSEFFRKAFKEGKSGEITLHGDHPDVVDAMIRSFYTFDYSDTAQKTSLSACMFHVKMFVAAEKYSIEHLQLLAAKEFQKAAKRDWSTDAFAEAIVAVYTTTNDVQRRLRDALVAVVKEHFSDLYATPGKYKRFFDIYTEAPDFGKDIALALASQKQAEEGLKTYKCPYQIKCFELFRADMNKVAGDKFTWRCRKCKKANTLLKTEFGAVYKDPIPVAEGV